jgi:hypothetical protein
MKFDYKEFHIDAPPLDEGDHYHAQAKIYRRAPWRAVMRRGAALRDSVVPGGCRLGRAHEFVETDPWSQLCSLAMPVSNWLESHLALPRMAISPSPASVRSGRRGHMTKISKNWNCTVCGSWLYQSTADGEAPNEWTLGERR